MGGDARRGRQSEVRQEFRLKSSKNRGKDPIYVNNANKSCLLSITCNWWCRYRVLPYLVGEPQVKDPLSCHDLEDSLAEDHGPELQRSHPDHEELPKEVNRDPIIDGDRSPLPLRRQEHVAAPLHTNFTM